MRGTSDDRHRKGANVHIQIMRFKLEDLPPHMRQQAEDEINSSWPKNGNTRITDAGEVRQDIMEVDDIHAPIIQWLERHGLWISTIYSRPDKRSTIKEGWPDFTVIHQGKACMVECKRPGSKPTKIQSQVIDSLMNKGENVIVVYNADQAIRYIRKTLFNETDDSNK